MIHFRWRAERGGGHMHVRVYAGSVPDGTSNPDDYTHANCGLLTFTLEEWRVLSRTLPGTITSSNQGDLPCPKTL